MLLIAILIAGNYVAHSLADSLDFEIRVGNEDKVHRTIILSAAVYAVLLAIPFVPGVEIGLALIALLGPAITFLVYVSTIAGLSLAFLIGRVIPPMVLVRWSEDAGLSRVSDLLKQIAPLDQAARARLLADRAPTRFVPFLLRHRYIALAVALNIPGNVLIGGGGGIASSATAASGGCFFTQFSRILRPYPPRHMPMPRRWMALVASCLRGALPPVLLRAVCFVRAIVNSKKNVEH